MPTDKVGCLDRVYKCLFALREEKANFEHFDLSCTMLFNAAVFASVVASAAAHATFQEMWVNGVDQGSWCVRLPQSNSPVTDVTSDVSQEISTQTLR